MYSRAVGLAVALGAFVLPATAQTVADMSALTDAYNRIIDMTNREDDRSYCKGSADKAGLIMANWKLIERQQQSTQQDFKSRLQYRIEDLARYCRENKVFISPPKPIPPLGISLQITFTRPVRRPGAGFELVNDHNCAKYWARGFAGGLGTNGCSFEF